MRQTILFLFILVFVFPNFAQDKDCYKFFEDDYTMCPTCGSDMIEYLSDNLSRIKYNGQCKEGVLNGKWEVSSITINKKLVVNQTGSFEKGKKVGEWTNHGFENIKPYGLRETHREVKHYNNGILNGPYKLYEDGVLYLTGEYKDGKRFGDWTIYTEKEYSGMNVVNNNVAVKKYGRLKYEWLENDVVKELKYVPNYNGEDVLEETTIFKNNLENGEKVTFSRDRVYRIDNYKDGEQHGLTYKFEENGDTISVVNYHNGKKSGLRRDYKYGRLQLQTSFIKDPNNVEKKMKHGTFITIFKDWTETISYDMGLKSGWSIKETRKSKEIQIDSTHYLKDKLNGPKRTYVNGKIIKESNYENSELHGKQIDYKNGLKYKSTDYLNGKPNGLLITYNEKGHPVTEITVSKDTQIQYFKAYKNNDLTETGKYINEKKDGPWITYAGNTVTKIIVYTAGNFTESIIKEKKIQKYLNNNNLISK